MDANFVLYDFLGEPVSYWHARQIEVPKPHIEKTIGHHIVIVDRSGSMWNEMEETKKMVEKVFTVEEFHDANLLLSLISYSSDGDMTVHFQRVPVAQVNKAGSEEIESLRQIRSSCLTSVSQALEAAVGLIGDETTAISLHTDGWFNDSSPASEKKKVDSIIKKQLSKLPNVLINTIAYRQSSDFGYLSQIANSMSGTCVLAKDVKQVYMALHDTTALLAGRSLPAIALGLDGADWQVALNLSQRKVNGAATDLILRGVSGEDEVKVYRFSKMTKATFERSSLPLVDRLGAEGQQVLAAFARTKLAEGKINEAKFALVTMRNEALLKKHYLALSSDQLMALAIDLDEWMREPSTEQTVNYGFEANKPTLVDLFDLLNKVPALFTIHAPALDATYRRKGVKRLEGVWAENQFKPCPVQLIDEVDLAEDPALEVLYFDVNTSEATINMTVRRDGSLQKEGKFILRVAGKKLDLKINRSYTIISDGQPNVETLPLMISDKTLYEKLKEMGYIEKASFSRGGDAIEGFDHRNIYEVVLTQFPVVPLKPSDIRPPSVETLQLYAQLLTERKILEAVLPDDNVDAWSAEQLEELKSYYLTARLTFNPPTTTPYQDKNEAAGSGLIDSYTRYKVSFGTTFATDIRSSLWSANEYLARRFEIEGEKKPSFSMLWNSTAKVSVKTLSARTKLTALDEVVMPVFESFFAQFMPLGTTTQESMTTAKEANMRQRLEAVRLQIQEVETKLSELALVVGSTGLIPDEWNAKILTGEELKTAYPDIDMPKAQVSSTFYETNGVLIGVHPEVAWYSTPKGVETAEQLMEQA